MKKKIILASSSPRRKEILNKIGLEFEIITSDYDEILENDIFAYEKIENLAYNKAKSVFKKIDRTFYNSDLYIILSADTVVVLNNRILGKPNNKTEAVNMLKQLSGKRHFVVTSVCAINTKNFEKKVISETSYVEFAKIDDQSIQNYVEKYKPLDKAGSYGIQELPEGFIKNIEGSFENIIGLCPNVVKTILKDYEL